MTLARARASYSPTAEAKLIQITIIPYTRRLTGIQHFVLTDDYSRKSWVILLSLKSETEKRLKQWVAQVERECGHSLERLRTDNSGEFIKHTLKDWLTTRGIKQEFTPPRSPQSNGVAERMNRTLQDKARSMMAQSGLRGGSWGEVFLAASYLRNCGPVSNQSSTPQEMWSGK